MGGRCPRGEPRAHGAAMTLALARVQQMVAYRTLIKYLVLKDLKVKSRGTYLGVGWTLMNPVLSMTVYYVVFRHIFHVGVPNFVGFFLAGFLMWIFFSRTVTSAVTCIAENESIVRKAAFPLEVLPLAAVLYQLVHHLLALALAVPVILFLGGIAPSWTLLWVVVVAAAFTVFTLAVSLWLSTLGVFFRDMRDICEVVLPMLFWVTPVFYTRRMAPDFLQPLLAMNPLSSFIGAMRAALLDGHAPAADQVGWMLFWLIAMLASGFWMFTRLGPRFAEEL
jgi:ABC-type polysaccharide/polyol phosphate export permease